MDADKTVCHKTEKVRLVEEGQYIIEYLDGKKLGRVLNEKLFFLILKELIKLNEKWTKRR